MKKTRLIQGAIPPEKISQIISKHSNLTHYGAHCIFLGQVRADNVEGKKVIAIEYSAYEDMVNLEIDKLKQEFSQKYGIGCIHIYHSVGIVNVGEVSLLVFISDKHRTQIFDVLKELVEEVKKRLPIWKKEIFEDGSYRWL